MCVWTNDMLTEEWCSQFLQHTFKFRVFPFPRQHNTKITKRLPSSTSIYTAEAKAIDLALNIITQTKPTKFIIFSDSLSVLKSLKNQNLNNPLTMHLLNRLEIRSKI